MKNLFKSVSGLLISLMLILLIAVNSVYASGGSEGGYTKTQWFEFAWKTLDVIILGGFLYWMLAAKIKEFFVGRRQDIKDSMENAKKEKPKQRKSTGSIQKRLIKHLTKLTA